MTQPTVPQKLATVPALGVRLKRTLTGANETRAAAILDDVSAFARSEAGKSWADPAAVPADIVAVVLAAALRVFTNPNMYVERRAGTFAHRIHDSAFATGIFTKAELAILARARGKSGLWTQSTYRGDIGCDDTSFVPVDGFGDPFPAYAESDPFFGSGDRYGDAL